MSAKHILLLSFTVVLIISNCSTNTEPTNSPAEKSDQVNAKVILSPTFTSVPTMTPTPPLDVSEWIVNVGGQKCTLEPFGDEFPGWYMVDCPEELWFPMGQTTTIEINLLDRETCTISPINDFETAIQNLSIGAMPVEFDQMNEGGCGCQVPYSDTAGLEVVCGFECGGEGIRVIFIGKTIRVNLKEENGGNNGFDDGTGGGSGEEGPPEDINDG